LRRGAPWPWLFLLGVSGLVIAAIAWDVWPRTMDLSALRSRPRGQQAAAPVAEEKVRVRLFLPHDVRNLLMEEERDIARRSVLADAVRAVLQELTKTTRPGTVPALPPTAEIRHVFVDAFGILYLDVGHADQTLTAGEANRAALAISAIVLTLTTNFSDVKRVQFLADGKELVAQIGTMDLRRPLQPRFPGEEFEPILPKTPDAES
jgi:hypothetical protein